MTSGMYIPICALAFSIVLVAVYFSKKRLSSIEIKIYKWLIITNMFGLILEILCCIFVTKYDELPLITMTILKTYLLYLIVWIIIFTNYVFIISYIKKDQDEQVKKNRINLIINVLRIFFWISMIIVAVLPLNIYNENGVAYTYGMASNATYIISGICIISWIICMLTNIKNIKNKEYLPLFIFIIVGVCFASIQMKNPGIFLITSMETLICFLMYFTIENPDMKMVNELNIAKDRAEKANLAKTEFLSSMSHEIRTPLNAVIGFSSSIKDAKDLKEAKEDSKNIIEAANSLLEIVNGILDISKIEANKIEIINKIYEPKQIFEEAALLAKSRLNEKQIKFKKVISEDIPDYLYGDSVRIKQIVINILTNAVKYTNEGFIEYRISCVKKDDLCRLIISVEDSGIGIKNEKINQVFNKFDRLGIENEATIEGTGLGLAITKKLLELMGGTIVVQSVYGKGSKFTVSIDQKIVDKVKKIKEEKVVHKKTKNIVGKKILIVDDNLLNLKVAERLLEKYELDITTVQSGKECLNKIAKNKYDLILLDDMMPQMNGQETFKKLKENKDFNTPTIMLTANAIVGMKEEYLSQGFDDYIAKPIDRDLLDKIITKYLN